MVGRGELTEEAWAAIAPLLPANGQRGGQWRDHRTIINGILWKVLVEGAYGCAVARCAGAVWPLADLGRSPVSLAPRWRRDGTWDRLLAHAQTKSDAVGEVVWAVRAVSVDSSTARAHQHASGARRRPSRADAKRGSRIQRMRGSGAAGAG